MDCAAEREFRDFVSDDFDDEVELECEECSDGSADLYEDADGVVYALCACCAGAGGDQT